MSMIDVDINFGAAAVYHSQEPTTLMLMLMLMLMAIVVMVVGVVAIRNY